MVLNYKLIAQYMVKNVIGMEQESLGFIEEGQTAFIEILSKFLLQTNGFGHKNDTYYNHVKYITMVIYIISLFSF